MRKLHPVGSFFSHLQSRLNRIPQFFHRHRIASMIVGQVVILAVVANFVLSAFFGINLFARADISCPSGETPYTVASGDTLGQIATAHNTSWQKIQQDSGIGNPNIIYVGQQVCVPGTGSTAPPSPQTAGGVPQHNSVNPFPPASCTWWAAQRYHDLHGWYVPWTTNSNANQWTARAYDFGWHVSNQPSVGAIINFQPGVQLSSSLGHVGVVEQILSNGKLVTSNMNVWNHAPAEVVDLTNEAGPGVTFITA